MAYINPPSYLQNRADHTAQTDRLVTDTLIANQGVMGDTDFRPQAQGTPNMSVVILSGRAMIKGTSAANQGMYNVINDANAAITVPAASSTLNRKDLIVARVYDSFYAGSTNEWKVELVQGADAATAVVPAQPATSILLAEINVPAGTTAITSAMIADKRPRAFTSVSNPLLMVTSPTNPTLPVSGMMIYETDTGFVKLRAGPSWVTINPAPVPFAMATGMLNVTYTGGTSINAQAIYPAGRFTKPPMLMGMIYGGAQWTQIGIRVHGTNGLMGGFFTLYAITGQTLPTSGTGTIIWYAVQMTADSAAG